MTIYIRPYLLSEVLNGNPILVSVFIQNPRCGCFGVTSDIGISFCDTPGFQKRLFPPFLPILSRYALIGCLERCVQSPAVQIAFKLGNVPLLAVIAAHLVKHLDEYSQERIDLCFADHIGLLVDVEQNAFGGNGDSPLEIAAKNFVVPAFGQEQIKRRSAINLAIFQKQCQHLQKVRFAGTKKTGNPHTVGPFIIVVGIQK